MSIIHRPEVAFGLGDEELPLRPVQKQQLDSSTSILDTVISESRDCMSDAREDSAR